MITFKCKMCGGDLSFESGASVAECPYCGTTQTLPKLDDDKRANLYDRANHFRRQNEYDKAMAIYEQILAEDRTDAEAYWSLVLCRYGIEYVEDPASHRRVPTVNRTQYASILADEDYKSALQYADTLQRRVYEAEANAIAEIQRGILDISKKEEPFDVFICYKETDANGRRTPDSVLANDMYHQLTKEGFKVFFSRITLEDKIGTAYEPYIFAALNSARVMVALGTKPEHFNAVWVKNEWSRYLALIRAGADKVLVPAYRDMDPYDLPEEFAHLQAQDMGKLGFMQDLIRGIKKILRKDEPKPARPAVQQVVTSGGANIDNLMKRARLFMEDGDWASANDYLDKVLDENAEYAPAYVGKVQTVLKLHKEIELSSSLTEYEKSADWQKALRFATAEQRKTYEGYLAGALAAREEKRRRGIYDNAQKALKDADTPKACDAAKAIFAQIPGYRDADAQQRACDEKAEGIRAGWYGKACARMKLDTAHDLKMAEDLFRRLGDYRDAEAKASECAAHIRRIEKRNAILARMKTLSDKRDQEFEDWNKLAEEFRACVGDPEADRLAGECAARAEAVRDAKYNQILSYMKNAQSTEEYLLAAERFKFAAECFKSLGDYRDAEAKAAECVRRAEEVREKAEREEKATAKKKRNTKIAILLLAIAAVAALMLYTLVIKPANAYKSAMRAMEAGDYDEAMSMFIKAGYFKDAATKAEECRSQIIPRLAQCRDQNAAYAVKMAAGDAHTVGLKSDGTVAAVGYNWYGQCDTGGWTDIVAVAAGDDHTVGLKSDGTVAAVGENDDGQCDTGGWTDIVAVAAGGWHTVGLKSDGTVAAVGENDDGQCDTGAWTDIVAVAAGAYHTVGLKSDGTVAAVGKNDDGQCDTGAWTDIVAVAAEGSHTVGLKSDGTVAAVGNNKYDQCDTGAWTDIVAVAAGFYHTVGLKSDGTVVAVGKNDDGRCDTGAWTDIVAVAAGGYHTVGLKSDGTVVAVGWNFDGQCDAGGWKLWD